MKNRIFVFLILLAFIFSFSVMVTNVFAEKAVPNANPSKDKESVAPEDPVKAGGYGLEETTKETSISKDNIGVFIGIIIKYVFAILGSILVALIIYGGVLYMTAAGNEKRVETAKTTLTYAVIGVTICLTGFVLTSYILGVVTGDTEFLEGPSETTTGTISGQPATTSDQGTSNSTPYPNSYLGTQAVMEYNDYKHLYFPCGKESNGCISDYQDICCQGYKCDTSKRDWDPTNKIWFGYCVKE